MKLLHVISTLDPVSGGPVSGLRGMVDAGRQRGVDAEVLTMDPPDAAWLAELSAPVTALGQCARGFAYAPAISAWLRTHQARFDAVVVHGLWQYQGIAVRQALRRAGRPYFVFPHGMLDPWFKRRYPGKHLKKQLFWWLWQYRVLRDAARVLFTCEEEERLARDSFRPYAVRASIVGFGAEGPPPQFGDARARFDAAFASLRGKRLVLFLGRLHPKKGCDLLLDAFAEVSGADPALHLVFAGPDQDGYAELLRRRARQLGIGARVSWTGMLQGDLKWAALQSAEVFALPSHQENFGVAVAEALACGTPVLLSDKVNIWREVIADGAGLVGSDDVCATTQRLREWMALGVAQREAMREAAVDCHARRFRFEAMVARLVECVEAVRT